MPTLTSAWLVEGMVESVEFELGDKPPRVVLSLFDVDTKVVLAGFHVIDLAEHVRAVCVEGNARGELAAIDLIHSKNSKPITDRERKQQDGRIGLVQIYEADPQLAEHPNVIERATELEVALIEYIRRHPNAVQRMSPPVFEKLVAEILASFGFSVEWTGRLKTTAADVIAFKTDPTSGLRSNYMIECKRYDHTRPVGVEIARSLYGAKVDEGFSNALLVTTSRFQDGVLKFSRRRWDFELRDFEGLVEWLNLYRARRDGELHMKHNKLILNESVDPRERKRTS